MCGVVGIASGSAAVRGRKWLVVGRDELSHRGPDDAGEWWSADGCVGLGHRRLAIIDLSPAGHQPMIDENGQLAITFNGEIYNFHELRQELSSKGHRFWSQSDTEVILAAYREWGVDCLAHLNGMFAFAIYDSTARLLFAARDRAGEKPFFYAMDGDSLRFASELKALMADPQLPRTVDPAALDCYLAMGFVPGSSCILRGINKLPPAHALTYRLDTGQARVWRYWSLPEHRAGGDYGGADETTLLDEIEALLLDAVRRQMLADVPVGVLLSGGVDSSLITACAARVTSTLKTFTIRFPGYGIYDETEHARLIARHFATDHHELEAEPTTVDLLPLLARQYDEPLMDSSMIPTFLVSRLVRRHCKVALGGDGGDELFAGYSHYDRLLWLHRWQHRVPLGLRRPAARVLGTIAPADMKGRSWLSAVGVRLERELPMVTALFDASARHRLMNGTRLWALVAERIHEARVPDAGNLLERATRMDFANYLPEDILVKVDRASMLNSLEVRAPLLDRRIIEFAFTRVPPHLRATDATRKVLLKGLASRLLPAEFDRRRKQGFSIPLDGWLRAGPWRDFFYDVLLASDATFDRGAVGDLLHRRDRNRRNAERLFGLVLFELWKREYRVSIG